MSIDPYLTTIDQAFIIFDRYDIFYRDDLKLKWNC